MLESLITSKTRLKLLVKFFVSANNKGHLRGLADEFNESTNAIRRELNQLTEAGFLHRDQEQNKVVYHANESHALFSPLKNLIHSYLGLDQIVDQLLDRVGDVYEIILIGDYAEGVDSGQIEVCINGADNLDEDYIQQLTLKVGHIIEKKIKVYVNQQIDVENAVYLYKSIN